MLGWGLGHQAESDVSKQDQPGGGLSPTRVPLLWHLTWRVWWNVALGQAKSHASGHRAESREGCGALAL